MVTKSNITCKVCNKNITKGLICSSICWAKLNRQKVRAYFNNWKLNNKDKFVIYKLKQHKKEKILFPVKKRAWRSDYKKRDKNCIQCGNQNNLEFHHTNYQQHIGYTLCRKCHLQTHNKIQKEVTI